MSPAVSSSVPSPQPGSDFPWTPMASQSSRFAFSHFQREATDRVNRLPKLRTPHDNQCDNNTELISSLLFESSCVAYFQESNVGAGGKDSAQTTRACGRVRSLRARSTRRIPSSETRTTDRGARTRPCPRRRADRRANLAGVGGED